MILDAIRRHRWLVALGLILTAATLLRLYGVDFGLPWVYHPDEPNFVQRSLKMLARQDFNPYWFGHPGTTVMYLLAALYVLLFVVGRVTGSVASADAFEDLFFNDPTLFYLSGRLMMVVFAILTILATYMLSRRVTGRPAAVFAAAILAMSPLHVYFSHVVRTDIVAALALVLVLWQCLNILRDRSWRAYLLAGFMSGLQTCL